MEGDGVLCRPHCFPACNAHQKCSLPDCYTAKESGKESQAVVKEEPLKMLVTGGGEEEEEGEEGAVIMAVRALDRAALDSTTSLCDRPCR